MEDVMKREAHAARMLEAKRQKALLRKREME